MDRDDRLAREAALEAARKARDEAREAASEAREALAVEVARFLGLDLDECRVSCEEMTVDDFKAFGEEIAGTKRDLRFLESTVRRGARTGRRLGPMPRTAARRRQSHARRSGHRRTTRSRAGPSDDDGPGEPPGPALALAPPPKTIYHYAASHCPSCGAVLLWSDGQLICCRRSCPRWGYPAAADVEAVAS